jgi:fructose-1,6-bisphosphatase/inositol monophosphatase family enzyme
VALPGNLIEQVAAVIKEVSAEVIEPRFDALATDQIREKSAGELVTDADEDAERLLTSALMDLVPDAVVVGEEACSADPTLLTALNDEWAWLVDPLDGTANFVAGSTDWATMVALLCKGSTVMSWIWQPLTRRMYIAERGSGASRDGTVLVSRPRPAEEKLMRGAVLRRFLPADPAARATRNSGRYGEITDGRGCAGIEYPAVVEGGQDFVLFWRTLPWDHAPGALLVEESGGVVRRPDGTPYRPSEPGVGLLVAADERTWQCARCLLD